MNCIIVLLLSLIQSILSCLDTKYIENSESLHDYIYDKQNGVDSISGKPCLRRPLRNETERNEVISILNYFRGSAAMLDEQIFSKTKAKQASKMEQLVFCVHFNILSETYQPAIVANVCHTNKLIILII